MARAIRNAIRANRFARIIRNWNPYFYSASGRFARITWIADSRESADSRASCESIRANHATKFWKPLRRFWGRYPIHRLPLYLEIRFCIPWLNPFRFRLLIWGPRNHDSQRHDGISCDFLHLVFRHLLPDFGGLLCWSTHNKERERKKSTGETPNNPP